MPSNRKLLLFFLGTVLDPWTTGRRSVPLLYGNFPALLLMSALSPVVLFKPYLHRIFFNFKRIALKFLYHSVTLPIKLMESHKGLSTGLLLCRSSNGSWQSYLSFWLFQKPAGIRALFLFNHRNSVYGLGPLIYSPNVRYKAFRLLCGTVKRPLYIINSQLPLMSFYAFLNRWPLPSPP